MSKFPRDLAKLVSARWGNMVAGDYVTPPCPRVSLLRDLLEQCFLAACSPEEGRYPSFNIVAFPEDELSKDREVFCEYSFVDCRPLTVSEIRRLAPAVDLKKSAICCIWNEKGWKICGLVDLGTSWHRAIVGLEYRYNHFEGLLVQIDRPGRIKVYQGAYCVATLADGIMEGRRDFPFHLSLHKPANSGLAKLRARMKYPAYEMPREFFEFEFIALWNTYAAIANSISLSSHGGIVIIWPSFSEDPNGLLKIKYRMQSNNLQNAFVKFMNARHVVNDYLALAEDDYHVPDAEVLKAEIEMKASFDALVEATRFVSRLSGCDGAIVLSDDLTVFGFGAEIRAELDLYVAIREVEHEFGDNHRACNIEEFGMRHRSAVKLASRQKDCRILAISQDGPISAVWSDKGKVFVKKGVRLANMNMPLV